MSNVVQLVGMVAKTNPDGASALMDEIVSSVMLADIAKAEEWLAPLYTNWVAERIAEARQSLLKSYVAKTVAGTYPDDGFHVAAEHLSKIAEVMVLKADWGPEDEKKHKRGTGGRFVTFVHGQPKNPSQFNKTPERLSPANQAIDHDSADPETQKKLAAEQGEWDEANRLVRDFLHTFPGNAKEIDAVFTFTDQNGRDDRLRVPLKDGKIDQKFAQAGGYDLESSFKQVELMPATDASSETKKKLRAFSAIGAATGSDGLSRLANISPEHLTAFGDQLNSEATDPSQTRRTSFFNRLRTGGQVLADVPGAEKYGNFARFAGEFGAEADRVLGPAAQRAAYRYRGTEKTPDQDLRVQFAQEMRPVDTAAASAPDVRAQAKEWAGRQKDRGGLLSPVAGSLQRRLKESELSEDPMSRDELGMKVRSDVAVAHMIRTLPEDPLVAELSVASGQVLPSQGVVIDRDGDLVSQSVGYAEDNYLPFDLGNLKRLKGGQYVRTRVAGGMTGEDVYTLAASGARMGTVVSSSGVFTLEMDPNYRGGRANPGQARQIYDRYLKILDAVEGSGLYARDLTPAQREEVDTAADLRGYEKGTEQYMALEGAARKKASQVTATDRETIADTVYEEIDNDARYAHLTAKDKDSVAQDLIAERVEEAKEAKVSQLSLNAEGYALALKTLQQQFPYFVRTASFEPLKSKRDEQGFFAARNLDDRQGHRQRARAKDKGYIRPGGLKSSSTLEGFYKPDGGRKTKTSEGYAATRRGTGAKPEASATGAPGPSGGTEQKKPAGGTGGVQPTGPLAQEIETNADDYAKKQSAALGNLTANWSRLARTAGVKVSTAGSLEQAVAGAGTPAGNEQLVAFLLNNETEATGTFAEALNSHPEAVLTALNDTEAVEGAANGALGTANADDVSLQQLGLKGVDKQPITNPREFAEYVTATAADLADYATLAGGQHIYGRHLGQDPFETTGAPLIPDIQEARTPEELQAFANKPENEQALRFAQDIALVDGKPLHLAQIDEAFAARITALKKLEGAKSGLADNVDAEPKDLIAAATKGVEPGLLDGLLPEGDDQAMLNWTMDAANGPFAVAQQLQTAWGLATTARVLDAQLGGGAAPKAPTLAGLRPLVGPSSPPADALAKAMAPALPPLPATWSPKRS